MNRFFERLDILRKHPAPLRFLVSRILMVAGCSQFFTICRTGYRLRFFPSALSAALWINPRERSGEEKFLRSNLRPGDTAIDVGANVGNIALALAAAVGPSGKVLAIEPHPRIFSYLKGNAAYNRFSQLDVLNCALGAERSTIFMKDRRDDDQNAVSAHPGASAAIEIPLQRLDDVAPPGDIALLKVDVEGYEYFVFSGAAATLRRTRMVYFEYVPCLANRFGKDAEEPWKPVLDAGLQLYQHEGESLLPISLPPKSKMMIVGLRQHQAAER